VSSRRVTVQEFSDQDRVTVPVVNPSLMCARRFKVSARIVSVGAERLCEAIMRNGTGKDGATGFHKENAWVTWHQKLRWASLDGDYTEQL